MGARNTSEKDEHSVSTHKFEGEGEGGLTDGCTMLAR